MIDQPIAAEFDTNIPMCLVANVRTGSDVINEHKSKATLLVIKRRSTLTRCHCWSMSVSTAAAGCHRYWHTLGSPAVDDLPGTLEGPGRRAAGRGALSSYSPCPRGCVRSLASVRRGALAVVLSR